jgi:hypothetical protein
MMLDLLAYFMLGSMLLYALIGFVVAFIDAWLYPEKGWGEWLLSIVDWQNTVRNWE